MRKRMLSVLLCLAMAIGLLPTAVFAEEPEGDSNNTVVEEEGTSTGEGGSEGGEKLEMGSKDATELKDNISTVTLSLPSAQEKLVTDVVFVLDKSSCNNDTVARAHDMLTALKAEVEGKESESNENESEGNESKINVGVVVFGGNAVPSYPLQPFPTEDDTFNVLVESISKRPDTVESGSNMHAGLLAAQEMLKTSTAAANRKYVILVSDGITYLFCKGGNYSTAFTRSFDKELASDKINQCGTLFELYTQYGEDKTNHGIPMDDINKWMNNISDRIETENDKEIWDYEYQGGKIQTDESKLLKDRSNVSNVEKSLYLSKNLYEDMQKSGYKCYAVLASDPPKENYPWAAAFMNMLADNKTVDFNAIRDNILYAVSANSTVVDTMGDDFDFNGLEKMKLTVGGVPLECKIDENNKNIAYFGDKDKADRFKVEYDEKTDAFTWTINENVSNFHRVQLSYQVKLVKRETAAGEHEVPTNKLARLTPIDSNGEQLRDENGKLFYFDFPIPKVSYTVEGSGGGGGGSTTTYYYFAVKKVDAEDNHALEGAKFGLFLDGKQIATATSDKDGSVVFRVSKSNYDKITDDSELYYQELTAPDGYLLNDTKYKIDKSDLRRNNRNVALKEADTVTNDLKTVPEDLNGMDHIAYVYGYPDGMVKPNNNVTRAETASMLYRLLTEGRRNEIRTTSNPFSDVAADIWYNESVSSMANGKYIVGYPDGTFGGDKSITRAEFVAMLVRFIGAQEKDCSFIDVSKDHWAYGSIATATQAGWLAGYPDGSFKPDLSITRAEAMTIINRVLNRGVNEKSELLNFKVWPDNEASAWYYYDVIEATNEHEYTGSRPSENWTSIRTR